MVLWATCLSERWQRNLGKQRASTQSMLVDVGKQRTAWESSSWVNVVDWHGNEGFYALVEGIWLHQSCNYGGLWLDNTWEAWSTQGLWLENTWKRVFWISHRWSEKSNDEQRWWHKWEGTTGEAMHRVMIWSKGHCRGGRRNWQHKVEGTSE